MLPQLPFSVGAVTASCCSTCTGQTGGMQRTHLHHTACSGADRDEALAALLLCDPQSRESKEQGKATASVPWGLLAAFAGCAAVPQLPIKQLWDCINQPLRHRST